MSVWRTKSVEQSIQDTDEPGHKLKRSLSAWDLTIFGVAVVIGAGIFTLTARVAATTAGPGGVASSFVIAAIACGLAAMCYAEFASTVPVAGSAYTFSYATLGELIAWIIGWDLVLELALGASVVAKGWSLYLGNLFTQFGGSLETTISLGPLDFDWGAVLIVAVITLVLVPGHQAVRPGEHGHHRDQGRRGAAGDHRRVLLLQRRNLSPFIPPSQPAAAGGKTGLEQPLLQLILGGAPSSFGCVRRAGGGLAGVLRVHRLRRRRHRGRGDHEPEAGPAAGHLRLAGHRHRAVRAGHHRADRRWCRTTNSGRCSRTAATTTTRPPWPPRSPPSGSTGRPTSSPSARWPA